MSDDPGSNEKFHKSLALYTVLASRPTTDSHTRLVCLAKKASLLDMHPSIRTFDTTCSKLRQEDAKTLLPSASFGALLVDRVTTTHDLAVAYKESGDAINASAAYDRAVQLMQELPKELLKIDEKPISFADMLAEWADVEQSLGRTTKASKIRDRSSKERQNI
ncbi:hypothetical protein IW140_004276 [Coemansia sp. RSA 1813]|nr:hypothetical protein EV178_004365 [Coemansia sp. RSA 1646]KAJ1769984.1 hypothetical protein LPJ74_003558 [Coemansia sp. RSA 1843]KAJ2088108.1 hypothetical protein IW138_004447 [Coemansia sp. RSA 986]KAJ2214832.1 hypothetical protein EV179_002642 [Coemansia sp. RSA 487]KAJ2567841.1 hypothetical protein IW140_004276 [Coemansia sp. RSA 1813]